MAAGRRIAADPVTAARSYLRQIRSLLVDQPEDCGSITGLDVWEHQGRLFEVEMASDVINDRMGLELTDLGSSDSGPTIEAFWYDDGSAFEFVSHYPSTLPFEIVERFVSEARRVLPEPGT